MVNTHEIQEREMWRTSLALGVALSVSRGGEDGGEDDFLDEHYS